MIRAVLVRVMLATEMSGCQRLKIPDSERERREIWLELRFEGDEQVGIGPLAMETLGIPGHVVLHGCRGEISYERSRRCTGLPRWRFVDVDGPTAGMVIQWSRIDVGC